MKDLFISRISFYEDLSESREIKSLQACGNTEEEAQEFLWKMVRKEKAKAKYGIRFSSIAITEQVG